MAEISSDQVLQQVKDVQVLNDAKTFKQLDTMNINACIESLQNLQNLLTSYKKLTETNIAAGTLYRDLVKKYFTSDYEETNQIVGNIKGLPGVIPAPSDTSYLSGLTSESEIASQCKKQFEESTAETYNVLKQLTNCFGKCHRDITSLVSDCMVYLNIINDEIEKNIN